jgi:hypothetical protein
MFRMSGPLHRFTAGIAILTIVMAGLLCRCGLASATDHDDAPAVAEKEHACCQDERPAAPPPCHHSADDGRADDALCPHCSGTTTLQLSTDDTKTALPPPSAPAPFLDTIDVVSVWALTTTSRIVPSFIPIAPSASPLRMKCALTL